ncbi:MAG: hypothetical protein ISP90_14095 [Nevskia sp.]|nr:hypothetical protein [Nevskia sp.]
MNQTSNTTSKAAEAPASPDNGMGHSPAGKEHVMMKHKHHKAHNSTAAKPTQPG